MNWIKTIDPADADGEIDEFYRKIAGPDGQVDNILKAHSLRPHTLNGHMAIYKAVLHHHANKLPRYLLELIGVYVSRLNDCEYCVAHHQEGLRKLLANEANFEVMISALETDVWGDVFDAREKAALNYARQLTTNPGSVSEAAVTVLRDAGCSDGEILEINQVTAYFAYANRTVLGLGVSHEDEELGQSPSSDNPENRGHQ
ncbi:MAG: peroxidase-related enzyme [Gammaproteobacteria bacterium]|nr:peroxidase-related enzyme [Gammaproteobacteria bacterium]